MASIKQEQNMEIYAMFHVKHLENLIKSVVHYS